MATTSLGLPLVDFDTDQPNGAGQMNALATAADALIAARLLPAAHLRVGHSPGSLTLSSGSNPVGGTWSLGVNIGDIAYSGGIFTVARAGAYRWSTTCIHSGSGSPQLRLEVLVNGADLTNHDGCIDLLPAGAQYVSTGGPINLAAGDTVQLDANLIAGVTVTVQPRTFGLYKVA